MGTDLSPIQPEYVPPNCRFEIDDADDTWVFNYKFDYIHGRYICAFFNNLPNVMQSIYDNLNPGGYVEFMETLMLMEAVDNSLDDHPLDRWGKLTREGGLSILISSFAPYRTISLSPTSPLFRFPPGTLAPFRCSLALADCYLVLNGPHQDADGSHLALKSIGKDPMALVHLKTRLAEAGFVNITEKKIAVPANPWARGTEQKIRGALMMTNLLEVCQGITGNVFTKILGWSPDEVEVFLVQVRAGLKDRNVHAYVPV